MERPDAREMLYEGKAKQVFATDDPDRVIVRYKDDATAFNAQKRGTVAGKGEVNNAITALLYPELEAYGVPTHFLARLSEREQLVRRVRIVPVEVIVRNRAAGTFASRYGVEEGRPLDPTVIEFCLKSDALGDPPMNAATAVALGHASEEELETLFDLAAEVNDYLLARFAVADLDLVDFKLEFGVTGDGELVLADEISPDTCRLWDAETGEKLDKDRFRRDLGGVEEAYHEVRRRLEATVGAPLDLPEPDDGHHHHDHDHAALRLDPTGEESRTMPEFRAVVHVMLRRSILDPQGRAVEGTLHRLGHLGVGDVRVGKRIELTLTGERDAVLAELNQVAERVLSNPVMEDVELELHEIHGD